MTLSIIIIDGYNEMLISIDYALATTVDTDLILVYSFIIDQCPEIKKVGVEKSRSKLFYSTL